MTNEQAIVRIQARLRWLRKKADECRLTGQHATWFEMDIESLEIATNAIRYCDEVERWQQSQQSSTA